MKTQAERLNDLINQSTNDTLILKLTEIYGDNKLVKMWIAIEMELENRLGEEAIDNIIEEIKKGR